MSMRVTALVALVISCFTFAFCLGTLLWGD